MEILPVSSSNSTAVGDSLNLPDHRIHKDGDGDASFQLKSDSLPHAHAHSTKTFYKHQDSRIMKAQELKTKTSAQTLIYKIFLQRYQVYQGRLLASIQDDAKYEHTKSKDNDKGSRSKTTKHEGTSLQRRQRQRSQELNDKSNLIDLMKECHNELTSGEIVIDTVGGLDHQSMEGVSQCMNVDEPYKNWTDVLDNFYVDGLDHQSVEGKSFVVDDLDFKFKDNKEASHSDCFLSTQQVKNVLDDVHIDSVVKDADESDVKTVKIPLPCEKFPSKACLSPYMQPPSTEVKCRKRCREIKLKSVSKRVIKTIFGSDGNEIQLLPWKEDLTCSPTAPKKTMSVPKGVMALFHDKNRMEMSWTFPWVKDGHVIRMDSWEKLVGRSHTKRGWLSSDYPLYYTNGVKNGVPWFANNVEKVYFPINEKDSH
ncbi:hypothetical protein Tco_1030744 [Tanacetum coccineum]|uniref:Uncharacterized protein n=1 Tax=Tanacetum coccineum TaxID=301880 RepID=A0ABQ5G734_9ASTR